jgi:hypothetical protein
MECDMKQLPDKAEIVKEIFTKLDLGPLRKDRSKAEARAAIERAIEQLREGPYREKPNLGEELGEDRDWYFRCGPHAASVKKAAKKLLKALEPYNGGLPANLKDPLRACEKGMMRAAPPMDSKTSTLSVSNKRPLTSSIMSRTRTAIIIQFDSGRLSRNTSKWLLRKSTSTAFSRANATRIISSFQILPDGMT